MRILRNDDDVRYALASSLAVSGTTSLGHTKVRSALLTSTASCGSTVQIVGRQTKQQCTKFCYKFWWDPRHRQEVDTCDVFLKKIKTMATAETWYTFPRVFYMHVDMSEQTFVGTAQIPYTLLCRLKYIHTHSQCQKLTYGSRVPLPSADTISVHKADRTRIKHRRPRYVKYLIPSQNNLLPGDQVRVLKYGGWYLIYCCAVGMRQSSSPAAPEHASGRMEVKQAKQVSLIPRCIKVRQTGNTTKRGFVRRLSVYRRQFGSPWAFPSRTVCCSWGVGEICPQP